MNTTTDPDAQCQTHGCAHWRCATDHDPAEVTITDDEILELREEAAAAGNTEQFDLCQCALGIVTLDIVGMTPQKARARCAEALASRG
jgi:hypothetical protein